MLNAEASQASQEGSPRRDRKAMASTGSRQDFRRNDGSLRVWEELTWISAVICKRKREVLEASGDIVYYRFEGQV